MPSGPGPRGFGGGMEIYQPNSWSVRLGKGSRNKLVMPVLLKNEIYTIVVKQISLSKLLVVFIWGWSCECGVYSNEDQTEHSLFGSLGKRRKKEKQHFKFEKNNFIARKILGPFSLPNILQLQ
jgi:hypothetical protein